MEEIKQEKVNYYKSEYIKQWLASEEFNNQELFDFIREWEWAFQAKAFCDSYHYLQGKLIRKSPSECTYWSIGFGTISQQGEVITLEEATKRKEEDILKRKALITSTCLTDNQIIATVDFFYQMGSNRGTVKEDANNCNISGIYNQMVGWRDIHKKWWKTGLVNREQRRINLYYN